ncbi:DUF6624 domain-containing protein [Sediminitomix flava]|uniref:Uncharacterized protein n=1 Tax=Sediminitomix flava TaxID=379075 RepID=A0A315YZ35_SEDFL|nr:DUF6624 domain-containing protein [Sediminitomix flava]PWJ35020.1 hypothetical protein BC781_11061 [Sediminitomix flava]
MKTESLLLILLLFFSSSCVKKEAENDSQSLQKESLYTQEALVAMLDTIWVTEQLPIRLRDSLGRVYGYESEEFNEQNEIYHKNHDVNEKKILKLLDTHGWPSVNSIGESGNLTICNVLQHSGIEVRKKYIPMMKKAVAEKGLAPRLLARAEDRLATDRGELQIYGGQIKYYPQTKSFDVWPIADPKNVDKRRAEIGLAPMAEFLASRRHPLTWDLEKQIKRTEAFQMNK